jgi:hypothetical protein
MKSILPTTRTIKNRRPPRRKTILSAKRKSTGIKLTAAPPGIEQEYQGGPPDNRRTPCVEEDTDTEEPNKRKRA